MNLQAKSAVRLLESISDNVGVIEEGVEVALFPPNTLIYALKDFLGKGRGSSNISLGSQNVHWEEEGAYTGETSVSMLGGLCKYVLVGHSERRRFFGENNAKVNRKIRTIIKSKLVPVICVGEQATEEDSHGWKVVLATQISSALYTCGPEDRYIFAYEPGASIGTGKPLLPDVAGERAGFIKDTVESFYDGHRRFPVPVVYGGSVNNINSEDYLAQSNIDGLLIGVSSLHHDQFCQIIKIANAAN